MSPEEKENFRETIPAAFYVPEVGKQNPLIHTTFFPANSLQIVWKI